MPAFDRLKKVILDLARGATNTYVGSFRGKLLKQHSNLRRVDVRPDSPDLPPLTNIPLKVGVPGVEVTLPGGHTVQVSWEDGRPDRPIATLWDPGTGGAVPLKVVWHGKRIELGGPCDPIRAGVLTGESRDPYTGMEHWMLGNASTAVAAKKS